MLFPDKKAIIVDVDGTLYNQKWLRLTMAFKLIMYYTTHFWKINELIGILLFRRYRYKEQYKSLSNNELIDIISAKLHLESYKLYDVRHYWMDVYPLKYIKKYEYRAFIEWLNNCNQKIYVYSDYEPVLKLDTLCLRYETAFFSDGVHIKSTKPDEQAMSYILNEISIPREQILYIGDDDKKDGKSANMAGISYINVKDISIYM